MNPRMERVAHIELTERRINIETISHEMFRKLLGGNGLAAKIMLERLKSGIDPLSPENMLIFATGPLTGSSIQGSDRIYIAAKSPLTGLFFDSCMGGRFASSLKQAGYDALVITGKADKPVYLFLDKGNIEIRDAMELAGKSPKELLSSLSNKMKDFEVCSIGIAGENLVKYAAIVHPRLTGRGGVAGRGGLGAVMGSKNLKAIVAMRNGEGRLRVYSDKMLKDVKETIQANLNAKTKPMSSIGTPFGVLMVNSLGAFGTRNFREEVCEYVESISGDTLRDNYYKKNISCHMCPVACGKLCELGGELLKNPEYETLYALGSMVGVDKLNSIIAANNLCDEYGLDTISMGVSIAFLIESFERGILSEKETDGYNLKFGDGNLILRLIEETARRRGIGNLLAEGTRRMSQVLGKDSWKYGSQAKGLELAAHSARAVKVMSIGYATGTRGGSHQDTRPRYVPGMSDYEGKAEQAIASQNITTVGDSLIQCRFVMEPGCGINFNEGYTKMLEAVTGWSPSVAELDEIGERIFNMERIFNVREGISRKDDTLPHRAMWEEIPSGPLAGQRTSLEKLAELLDQYYQVRGWDDNGIPRRELLERLGLKEYLNR